MRTTLFKCIEETRTCLRKRVREPNTTRDITTRLARSSLVLVPVSLVVQSHGVSGSNIRLKRGDGRKDEGRCVCVCFCTGCHSFQVFALPLTEKPKRPGQTIVASTFLR